MTGELPRVFLSCAVFEGIVCTEPTSDELLQVQFLDAGLHATPKKLQARVQAQIDAVDQPSVIILGYGLCGNGLHNIQAGPHTLIIPKMDDCIAMFMGSRNKYLRTFAENPGTYYLTKGWLQAEVHPLAEYQRCVEKYGVETADYIMDTQYQHYNQLVFVAHSQVGLDAYREIALEVAAFCERWGMVYQELHGTVDFVESLDVVIANPAQADEAFIVIQPGEVLTQELFR